MKPLSATRLARFRKSPPLYWEDLELKGAARFGKACHAIVLEGEQAYQARFITRGPVNPSTGKAFSLTSKTAKQWEVQHGMTLVGEDVDEKCRRIARSVKEHKSASLLLTGGRAEVHVEAKYMEIPCHGYLDYLAGSHRIVEFKTCDDLDWFERQARKLEYVHQVAFYRALVASRHNKKPHQIEVFFIACEKQSPFRCGVWRIGQDVLAIAAHENEEAITRLKRCFESNTWRTGYEETRVFDCLY